MTLERGRVGVDGRGLTSLWPLLALLVPRLVGILAFSRPELTVGLAAFWSFWSSGSDSLSFS